MSTLTESDLRELIQLMHINPNRRSLREVAQIARLISNVAFFSNYQEAVKEACCRQMRYAEYEAGSFVFRKGDQGDSFCIILRGKVGVLIPATALSTPTMAMVRRVSKRGLEPPSKKNSMLARTLFAVSKFKKHIKKEEDEDKSTSKEAEKCPVDDETAPNHGQVEVSELGPGCSFGELALIQDCTRSASILCKTATVLAVLTKHSFNSVLKEEQAKRLNEKITFIQNIPAFRSWSRLDLSKLTYYLKERGYKWGQKVYEEGDTAEEAFIVLEGAFKLTKTLKIEGHHSHLQLVIKAKGELFGESEILSDQARPLTCTCESTTGRLWCIAKFDFLRRVQNAETWSYIYRKTELQKRWLTDRMDCLLDVESRKLQTNGETVKSQVEIGSREVGGLKDKLKHYSNTVLEAVRGAQTDRVVTKKPLRTVSRDNWSHGLTQRSHLTNYLRKMHNSGGLSSRKVSSSTPSLHMTDKSSLHFPK